MKIIGQSTKTKTYTYREKLQVQTKASMRAPSNTLQYNFLPRFLVYHFTTMSGSLQLCPEIVHGILIVPEFT